MAGDAGATGRALSEPEALSRGPDAAEDGESEPQASSESDGSDGDDGIVEHPKPSPRRPVFVGMLIVVVLAGLTTYLGLRAHQAHQVNEQRNLFLQVARQGAVNLTTIDWEHADADIQRILRSATGQFYDDFSQRSQPFLDVVKQFQSKSVGTVTEAGIESCSGEDAQALVSVAVITTGPGVSDPSPRNWRMRMSVQKLGGDLKVSKVEFVS